jgi:uncharacterized protein YoxC
MQPHETIELAFVVIAALALLSQTIILLVVIAGAAKAAKSLKEEINELRSSVMPIVHTTRDLVDSLSPKVDKTVADIADIAHSVRKQAIEFEAVTAEVLTRVRHETGRIDTMFSGTLDAVDKAGQFVTHAVSKPVRQISGVLASLKAILEALRNPEPPYHHNGTRDDKDLFV